MASSLEDLLAEDGFRGRKSLARSRNSFKSESPNLPPFPFPARLKRDFLPRDRIRTERTRSDVSRHSTRGESPMYDTISGGARPRDNLVRREKIVAGPKKEVRDEHETGQVFEIVEVGDEENERVKDIYSNEEKYSNRVIKEMENKDKNHGRSSRKHMLGRRSYSDNNMRGMKQKHGTSDHKDASNGKGFEETQVKKNDNMVNAISEPALDEVAIQAMVSILSGYIKRFLRDREFRSTLRDNCFSSLDFAQVEEGNNERKIIAKLEEAIEAIEKAVEEATSTKDLKKAVLQLSVIVGLKSSELKDGFTSGVPNYKLSACAHLYLSVVYKLQRKDRVAAKHLLQVFCDSPNQARTNLLPELWDYLFSPQLSHLKVWYNEEENSLADSPARLRKLKTLEKVYNEIVDSGTYQFAVYYKDWLTEGVEATPVPSIHVPSISIREIQKGSSSHGHSSEQSSSPADPFSPQPMLVSKKFYNAVFSHSSKPGSEDGRDTQNSDNCLRSSDGSAVVKETVKDTDGDVEEDLTKSAPEEEIFPENGLSVVSEEKWSFPEERVLAGRNFNEKFVDTVNSQETLENGQEKHSPPNTKENELTLKRLAKSLFELQQPDSEASIAHHSLVNLTKVGPATEELHGVYFEERPSFSTIPQDFICPLTGQLFEDPVTLETGQTFERKAIKVWFDQGNRTCPVTGKALECKQVPSTNLVLKRLVDTWKSQHCRHLLEQLRDESDATTLVLEQLLLTTAFTKEERIANAKQLLSLGGLQFLLQRFKCGDMEEKTRVMALLVCCVEAESGCRNRIARDIDKKGVLELLHSKQAKARANVVVLLIELICLKRKNEIARFLHGLQNEHEGIERTMHVLLLYLQSSPPPQRPLVAVLLLYLDVLVEPRKYSIYREEAVDAITEALEASLADEKIRENCCRALLILGGRFSSSGKLLTDRWILNRAGFNVNPEENLLKNRENDSSVDDASSLDDDKQRSANWLRDFSASLLGNGKRSFLEAISKCLGSENLYLVKVCLTTVAWLSSSLASMSETELHLPAFSALISRLKNSLENGYEVEHKVLASSSLLNFSKISECRVLLMSMAENIRAPLESLVEVTWTAKMLCSIISGEAL